MKFFITSGAKGTSNGDYLSVWLFYSIDVGEQRESPLLLSVVNCYLNSSKLFIELLSLSSTTNSGSVGS